MEKLAYPRGIFHPTVQWVLEAGQFALLSFSSFLCLCVGMCTYKYMELYMSIFVYIHVYVFIYVTNLNRMVRLEGGCQSLSSPAAWRSAQKLESYWKLASIGFSIVWQLAVMDLIP